MDTLFVAAVVIVIFAAIVVGIGRSHELFVVQVDAGKSKLRRGRLPRALLNDIQEVVKRARITSARITVVRDGESKRVLAPGLDDGQLQQLRNVVGAYSMAKIRGGMRRA